MFLTTFTSFAILASAPPPKNIERNILGYVYRLKFFLLCLLIAQFNNKQNLHTQHIHNTQQQPKWAAFALPLAALPSHFMGISAETPMHGAAAPYGFMDDKTRVVLPRRGRFPY
jgi:hypothetical protein